MNLTATIGHVAVLGGEQIWSMQTQVRFEGGGWWWWWLAELSTNPPLPKGGASATADTEGRGTF